MGQAQERMVALEEMNNKTFRIHFTLHSTEGRTLLDFVKAWSEDTSYNHLAEVKVVWGIHHMGTPHLGMACNPIKEEGSGKEKEKCNNMPNRNSMFGLNTRRPPNSMQNIFLYP